MKLVRAACYAYELPLVRPLRLGDRTLTERSGWLVCVEADSGRVGWGDVAPLPGFSRESADDAWRDLQSVLPSLQGADVTDEDAIGQVSRAWPITSPSVRFGLETAVWTAATDDPPALLWGRPADTVNLSALLAGTPDEMLARARELPSLGYRDAKLKIGRRAPAEDADLVRRVLDFLGPGVTLRLDANRSWAFAEAQAFAKALAGTQVTCVEEPLRDPARLADFHEATGLAFALDETLAGDFSDDCFGWPGLYALVVKPTLVGGVRRVRDLWRQAQDRGIVTIMSAAFESGVGLRALAWLAAGQADVPAGLDTHRRLAADVLDPRLELDAPDVQIAGLAAARIDLSRLRRVL